MTWLDGLGGDLRYGIRILGHRRLLASLVVLTLSLGIGANAAIFSVFQAVLLRPLPYPAADRLVLLTDGRPGEPGNTSPTIPELVDVRTASRSFDAVSFFDTRDFQVTGGDEPQRVVGARVEPSFLSMLGVRPQLGRIFGDADVRDGGAAIVLLGNGMWRQNFGADPAVIGRTLALNGVAHEIVGVMPETFSFGYLSPASVDIFVPYPTSPEYMSRSGQFSSVRRVNALARLAPGVLLDGARAELDTIARAIAAAHPDLYPPRTPGADAGFVMTPQPLRESLTRGTRPVLMLLFGAVVVVLLIACVNTAQFLLAQAIDREPEVAVRSALGAGRARLVRQFMSEALLLAGGGGLLGVAQASWLIGVLRGLIPRNTSLVGPIGVNGPVLLFLLGITIATAVACVLVPAVRFSQVNLAGRFDTRGAAASRGRLRHAFIAIEVALSLVLLVGAGLLLHSLLDLQRAQGGFSADGVTVLRMRGIGGGPEHAYSNYLAEITKIPAIDAAGITSSVLPGRPGVRFTIPGESPDAAVLTRQQASYQIVSRGYFAALGIPLEAGRLFTEDDATGKPPVAVVNREMARQFWSGGDPIGRQIRAGDGPRAATMTVVGVVGNVRPPFQSGDVPQLYVSYRQQSEANIALVVRTPRGSGAPVSAIKQAIWSVDPRQAVFGIDTLDAQLAQATAGQRAIATLIAGFAALALAMSVSGVYTVITYLVSRRSKEIAVRRAVGATARDGVWSLAAPTLRWTAVGLLAGTAGAIAGTRLLRAAVTGLSPLDVTLMAVVTAAYLAVVCLAIAAASRGALRIDPSSALRAD